MKENAPAYVIGLDYGTNSVRALLVEARTGAKVAAVHYYPRWQQGQCCHPAQNRFRQHPLVHLEGLEATVRAVAAQVPAAQGVGLGLLPDADNPNALFVRWKNHTALAEAAVNHKARTWGGENFTKYSGGIYSSEWFRDKILHVVRQDAAVAQAAHS